MTLLITFIFGVIILFFGYFMLITLQRKKENLGSLTGERVYADSDMEEGETLIAKTFPLRGKPDYIMKQGDGYIPVEVKTGKTPADPYLNHTMQLMAYCVLVQDTYGVRPQGGIIKYPEKEFKIAYTPEAEASVKKLIEEMVTSKKLGTEFQCSHKAHNLP